MSRPNKTGLAVVVAAALSALGTASAGAAVVYTYTGNDYTSVISPFTTSESVSGSFTLSTALGDSLSGVYVAPLSFSFSDGVATYNSLNSLSAIFVFSTDASGHIIAWEVGVGNPTTGNLIVTCNAGPFCGILDVPPQPQFDEGLLGRYPNFAYGANSGDPGTWSVSQTPLPAAFPLFATGLCALGLLGWRRKRKNAAALAAA